MNKTFTHFQDELAHRAAAEKIDKALKSEYKTTEAMNAVIEKVIEATKKRCFLLNLDHVSILNSYRQALGEDLWKSIGINASLYNLLSDWIKAEMRKNSAVLVEEMKKVLPEYPIVHDYEIESYMGSLIYCNHRN